MRHVFVCLALLSTVAAFAPRSQLARRQTIVAAETSGGGLSRRSAVASAVAAAALAIGPASAPAAGAAVDYKRVGGDVAALVRKDPDKGPTLVRLAWHASGTYSKIARDGGSGGGTIRFQEELAHGANAGLAAAVAWLEPIKKKYGAGLSYADLYTLAGVSAISQMGGPKIGWGHGRVDALDPSAVTPDGRLPAADKGSNKATAAGLRDVFGRMGFNDQEIVALSGAHALGRCHPDASGYSGPWSATPTLFTNSYFALLENVKWTKKEWSGPLQYEDASGKLMMLPSDLLLVSDPGFKPYVKKYAKSQKLFFEDFAGAFQKLEELGTSGLVPTAV